MNIDDIMLWISKKNNELFLQAQQSVADDEKWNQLKGAYDILEELRLHILTKKNPYNREDIKNANNRNDRTA